MNILIIGVNWVGDALFMTPAIRAIRRAWPSAFLACVVPPRAQELLQHNPHLDAVIPFNERAADRGILGLWGFVRMLRTHRFDQAFLFHRSFTRTLCVALAGIRRRTGYGTWKRRWLLTTAVPMPPRDSVHKVLFFLRLVEAAGIAPDGLGYDLSVSAADQAYARQLLEAAGCQFDRPVVAMHAGANWHLKRWPTSRFARLGDLLAERYGAQIVLVGSADDRLMAEGIGRRMEHPARILCGQTTLPQLGAVFQMVRVVVSNDSGPLHVAAAVGARTLGLFGPTDPELTAPRGPAVRILFGSVGCPVPCYRQWCPVNLCLRELTPARVADALSDWLR